MGKWDIIIKDEFDGHLVVVEAHAPGFEANVGHAGISAVRLTITCLRDCDEPPDEAASGQTMPAGRDAAGALITLHPETLDGLEGDLIEVGFSTEAAALIASRVCHRKMHDAATC